MLVTLTVVVVFSVVILVHELGHFIAARRIGVKVEKFSLGFGRVLLSRKKGDTEYAISAVPIGGYIKMAGEEPSDKHEGKPWEFSAKPPGKRFWVLIAGAAMNFILAIFLFSFVTPTSRAGVIFTDMPAYKAGIRTGDRIISINGKKVDYWYQVLDMISKDAEASPLSLKVSREGKTFELNIVPQVMESKDIFGSVRKRAMIGISYYPGDVEIYKGSPLSYIVNGLRQSIDNTLLTYRFIWYIITGKVSASQTLTGPVGIVKELAKAVRIGIAYLLYLIAHINLALAVFNLLPFPVLDGGHIIFLALEKVRRRPLSLKAQEVIQYIGISLLIALMLFVTYNDIFVKHFLR